MLSQDTQHRYRLHTFLEPDGRPAHGTGFGTELWMRNVATKPRRVQSLLHEQREDGSYVIGEDDLAIFSDADVLPLRAFSALVAVQGDMDFRVMHEPWAPYHRLMSKINSGFYTLRNTHRTRALVDTWVALILEHAQNNSMPMYGDQPLLDRALHMVPELRWQPIPWPLVVRPVSRASAGINITRAVTNETIAFHAATLPDCSKATSMVCQQRKLQVLALVAQRFPERKFACLSADELREGSLGAGDEGLGRRLLHARSQRPTRLR